MSVVRKSTVRLHLLLILLLCLQVLTAGCGGKTNIIGYENQIALHPQKKTSGTYSQDGQTIHYTYYQSGNTLEIEGHVQGRPNVLTLEIQVLFLNEDGLILDNKPLYYSGYRAYDSYEAVARFDRSYTMPDDGNKLSFDFSIEYRNRID